MGCCTHCNEYSGSKQIRGGERKTFLLHEKRWPFLYVLISMLQFFMITIVYVRCQNLHLVSRQIVKHICKMFTKYTQKNVYIKSWNSLYNLEFLTLWTSSIERVQDKTKSNALQRQNWVPSSCKRLNGTHTQLCPIGRTQYFEMALPMGHS